MAAPAHPPSQKRAGLHPATSHEGDEAKNVPTTIPNTTSSSTDDSTNTSNNSNTAPLMTPPERCLSYLDLTDLGRLLLTSHHLHEVAKTFIRVLQADITRGQSLLHSPLPCLPPSSSGVPPLPLLPYGFEWIDAVVMPPGKQNRRLLRVKRKREEEVEGEEEEEEEGGVGGGCTCGEISSNSNRNSNKNSNSNNNIDFQEKDEDGDAPSCCEGASCPCFRRAYRISRRTTKSSNDTTTPPSRQPPSSSFSAPPFPSSLSTFEFECSSRCRCSTKHCSLRPTQARPSPVLQLRYTTGKGWGVFFIPPPSLLPFLPADTFVAEYVGELIGTEEARRRLALYDKQACPFPLPPSLASATATAAAAAAAAEDRGGEQQPQDRQQGQQQQHHYLLTLLEEGPSFLLRTSLDATHKGNVSRFVNHSCAPNLRIACVRDGGVLPRLCLFTSKEVKKGEELTFAYGEGSSEGGRVCRCGAGDCQGVLPFHPGL